MEVWWDIHGIYIPPVIKHGVLENPWFIGNFQLPCLITEGYWRDWVLVINSYGNGYNGDIKRLVNHVSLYIFARFCELLYVHQIRDLLAGTWPKSRAHLLLSILEDSSPLPDDGCGASMKVRFGGPIWYHFRKDVELKRVEICIIYTQT